MAMTTAEFAATCRIPRTLNVELIRKNSFGNVFRTCTVLETFPAGLTIGEINALRNAPWPKNQSVRTVDENGFYYHVPHHPSPAIAAEVA